jgi:hypothetical protein
MSYVLQNPLRFWDPFGLCEEPGGGCTVYFGGAGNNGPYIPDQVKALKQAGVKGATAGTYTEGTLPDASAGTVHLRDRRQYAMGTTSLGVPYKNELDWSISSLTGISLPQNMEGQFNLVGYSYGSLVAAQSAIYHADKGQRIDNLVLIGSPISPEFLAQLRAHPNIGNVIVKDLGFNGDAIRAGMSMPELLGTIPRTAIDFRSVESGAGHFYYAPSGPVGQTRRRELADELVRQGLR